MSEEGMMELSKRERSELQRQAGSRNGRADSARHARLILLLAEGLTWSDIRVKLDCGDSYIARWSKRFVAECLRTYLEVVAATGCRRGEVLALRWADLQDGRILVARSLSQT